MVARSAFPVEAMVEHINIFSPIPHHDLPAEAHEDVQVLALASDDQPVLDRKIPSQGKKKPQSSDESR